MGPLVHIGLNFLTDCGHDRFQQVLFLQQAHGFIRRQAVVNLTGQLPGGTGKDGFQGQEGRAAIGIMGMGIHDALGDFDQFADMTDDQDVGKAFVGGIIESFADIVADGHALADVDAQIVAAEIDAVIAEKGQ